MPKSQPSVPKASADRLDLNLEPAEPAREPLAAQLTA